MGRREETRRGREGEWRMGGWREGGKMQFQLLGSEERALTHAERQAGDYSLLRHKYILSHSLAISACF